jgi:hypothetical protein
MGSPPPAGSKNVVFKFRSVNNIVMPPASTGRDSSSNSAVMNTDHTNSVTRTNLISKLRMFINVVMKLIAPRMEEIPAR